MKLSFHGADRGVTGSCHLVECAGRRVLIDCGLYQGGRELEEENADNKTTDYVYESYDNTGDCVTTYKLTRSVHCTIKFSFFRDFRTTCPGLGLIYQSGVKVRINAHLFTGHGVEGKPGGYLSDSS